jgi:hypothetical protein
MIFEEHRQQDFARQRVGKVFHNSSLSSVFQFLAPSDESERA